ncbi:hypothetical protein GQ600_5941 [Phytophthora cactorum]|nr:hypothetical protein GQ600_5941 [Phytophthora cactorum]
MVYTPANNRDPHRSVMLELATESISGSWTNAPSETRILYSSSNDINLGVPTPAPISSAYVEYMLYSDLFVLLAYVNTIASILDPLAAVTLDLPAVFVSSIGVCKG